MMRMGRIMAAFQGLNGVDVFLRILVAFLLGGLIGLERETIQKPAGLRTHVLVSIGSALFTIVSIYGFPGADPARVAAQIVSGIGFLGAGTIIKTGEYIRGLTTAATLWVAASIGIACGIGEYYSAFITTMVTLLALVTLRSLEKYLAEAFQKLRPIKLVISIDRLDFKESVLNAVLSTFSENSLQVKDIWILPREDRVDLDLYVVPEVEPDMSRLYSRLSSIGVKSIKRVL